MAGDAVLLEREHHWVGGGFVGWVRYQAPFLGAQNRNDTSPGGGVSANLGVKETAATLGVAPITVKRDWAMARAWLFRELRQRTP
jgi:hypothetical protein